MAIENELGVGAATDTVTKGWASGGLRSCRTLSPYLIIPFPPCCPPFPLAYFYFYPINALGELEAKHQKAPCDSVIRTPDPCTLGCGNKFRNLHLERGEVARQSGGVITTAYKCGLADWFLYVLIDNYSLPTHSHLNCAQCQLQPGLPTSDWCTASVWLLHHVMRSNEMKSLFDNANPIRSRPGFDWPDQAD